jgi:DNA mismatch repair protein MutS2
MAEVGEIGQLARSGRPLPSLAFAEVDEMLTAAEKALLLGADELRPIAALCDVAQAVADFFTAGSGEGKAAAAVAPLVAARAARLDPCRALAAEIRRTFDAAGEVRDDVSPELGRLRRERELLSARVRSSIEELMRSEEFAGALQDQFVTVRQDRFVLPLKASAKSLGLGIVHDTSRTGETVFVEPTAVVGLNNRLKLVELDIGREIRRILEQLTARVAEAAPALREDVEILSALDVINAKARLGVAYDGQPVAITDTPQITLREARHPLLVLRQIEEGFSVVANDVSLAVDGARVLIVSGPNAGGKTVLLKTVGLAALLARAGMLVPAAPGGRVGFFDAILADIGDSQSVMGDLSTFSSHLKNIAEILRIAAPEPKSVRSLVLLDEVMAGTNPEQGAALARATVERLADLHGVAVVTTHYDSLKGLAEADSRFRNAGMEYDVERLRPTFRLKDGAPGRSYALDIASRMGLPLALLDRARELAGASSIGLEEVIANLEAREAALDRETARLSSAREALADSEADQRTATEALIRRERELARFSRAAIEESVREAREALRAIVRSAQQAGSSRAAEDARVVLTETAAAVLSKLPVDEPVVTSAAAGINLVAGARVFVPSLGADGVIVKTADAKGRVKVTVGVMTIEADAASLETPRAASTARHPPSRTLASPGRARAIDKTARPAPQAAGPEAGGLDMAFPNAGNTLDLRGHRVDEGLAKMEAFLDRAALEGVSPVFVIHGHGTGALRAAVREQLARSVYVRRSQPGGKGQGGDGVTVIEL